MSYFVYKLNVGASVVQAIEKKDTIEYLKQELVLNTFDLVLGVEEINKNIFKVGIPVVSKSRKLFIQEWEVLNRKTEQHYELYIKTVDYYKNTGQVLYSEDFLLLTEECGNLRRRFENNYPNLKEADLISDKYIENKYQIPVEFRVGTGITHLRRFYKLLEIVQTNPVDFFINDTLIFYYNSKTEHIIIESEDENSVQFIAQQIESYLQKNKQIKEELGYVKIVPIYLDVKIADETEISEIEYTIVYPNPVSKTVDDVLLGTLRETGGEEQITKITNKNNLLDIDTLLLKLRELAQIGYLKDIRIKMKRQQKRMDMEVKKISRLEEDNNE